MENIDNNMEDFFKKRLNSFNEPIEDWAKPDSGDWDKAMSQIPMFNQTSFWTLTNIGMMGLGAVLIGSILYIVHLKKEITVLEKNIETQQERVEKVETIIQTIEKKYSEEQIVLTAENEGLKKQNEVIINQNQILKNIAQRQEKAISNIEKTSQQKIKTLKKVVEKSPTNFIKSSNEQNQFIPLIDDNQAQLEQESIQKPMAQNNTEQSRELLEREKLSVLDSINQGISFLNGLEWAVLLNNRAHQLARIDWNFIDNSLQQQKRKFQLPQLNFQNIEVSYEHRLQTLPTTTSLGIKELETIVDKENSKESIIRLHGLTIGLPIAKKWRIQTGVRYSNTAFDWSQEATSIYKSTDEYPIKDGVVAKDLTLQQTTPFAKSNTSVQLVLDEEKKLKDGDAFEWYLEGKQEQRTIQIPLGVTYALGGNKLKWLIGAGTQWNQIKLGEASYSMKFDEEEKEFEVFTGSTDVLTGLNDFNYFSAYGTLGVQYQLRDNWSIRGTAAYNYHFLPKGKVENWNNHDKSIAIGLVFSY